MSLNLVNIFKHRTDDMPYLKELSFLRVTYSKKQNTLYVILKGKIDLQDRMREAIKAVLKKELPFLTDVNISYYKDIGDVTLEQIVKEYWVDLVHEVTMSIPVSRGYLLEAKKEVVDKKLLKISNNTEFIYNLLKKKGMDRTIADKINDMFGVECRVLLEHDTSSGVDNSFIEENQKELKKMVAEQSKRVMETEQKASKPKTEKVEETRDENVIMGRKISGDITPIKEVTDESGRVIIRGEIFKLEVKETKTGRKIIIFNITDNTSSITVKCFPRPKDVDSALEGITKGLYCMVRGEAMIDQFTKELVIMGNDIGKLVKVEKVDLAENKRVELHAHTQMSSMDAVVSPGALVGTAAKWGHPAIAITDHGVVQGFPEAMDAAKKSGIKLIYGVEGYLVDDGEPIVVPNGVDLTKKNIDDEIVVFDVETTGFSPINDRIIEIGAVKIKDGEVIDSFNVFVNPEMRIPYEITELTGISDDMVKDAEKIDTVLPKFLDFIGDAVVAAHNANFDTSFIKKNSERLGLEYKSAAMDTIPLCKYLYPELGRYKLNNIAKHLGISLENHHRAVDDARATGEIITIGFEKLREQEVETLDELNAKFRENFNVKKANANHVIILVKTQEGLKNLYKLVSKSNLEYFFRTPRIPKSVLEEHREGLIIGSACEAGEVYKAILSGKDNEELNSVIDFYDYLEIQPIGNNDFMIQKGIVKSKRELEEINERIYEVAKENDMPIVATGDVHFLNPEDEVYRRILMASKGFSDADNQPPLYMRTTDEMLAEFEYLGKNRAYEVVVTNTNMIADMVDEGIKAIPDGTFPPKIDGADEEITKICWDNARAMYGEDIPEIVSTRLKRELDSIIGNGYGVLYLISQKLVAKSESDGYLVGSRGSVGSSFAATMSGITEVNGLPPHYVCPECKNSEFITDGSVAAGVDMEDKDCPECGTRYIKEGFDIPFETFLGFEGDKEPDIDLNFSGDNQADVHKYTEYLFGEGYTFKAGTIGTIADKTAYGFVKKYIDEREMIIPNAEIERLSAGCTGVKRTSGQHPGGIMVVPSDNEIYNFCPIQRPADDPNSDITTTHFDYHSISGRLLKLDILGHDDPTVLRMLKDVTGIDPRAVPLGDPKVLSIFQSPEALGITEEELGCEVGSYGVPEFGTKFVRQMLVDTKPETFSDLVRISGLSHGTDVWLNNAQEFIRDGYTTLKDCISTRDDIMVYLIYAGLEPKLAFTIMEKVRKGRGVSEEHEAEMRKHDVPDWYIESCKRIKYMFPKGHAVAYVMMAVRIAYFKVYHPKAYYCAYFTIRADEFDGTLIVKGLSAIEAKMKEIEAQGNAAGNKEKGLLTSLELCKELYLRGIKFLPVDLYKSEATTFIIEDEGIRMPFSALEGVGENAAKGIVAARGQSEFISKEDLRVRAKVTKTVIEALDDHGCLQGMSDTNQLSFF